VKFSRGRKGRVEHTARPGFVKPGRFGSKGRQGDETATLVAELPVLEMVSALHIPCDLTLGLGTGVNDYLAPGPE
jgi:hypothetical protein